jgi:hypothetical protein
MLAQGSWQGAVGAYLGFGCDVWGTCTDAYVRAVFGWAAYYQPIIADPRHSGLRVLPKDWAYGPITIYQLPAPPKLEEPPKPKTPTPTPTGSATPTPNPGETPGSPEPGDPTPVPTEQGQPQPTAQPTEAPPTEAPTAVPTEPEPTVAPTEPPPPPPTERPHGPPDSTPGS